MKNLLLLIVLIALVNCNLCFSAPKEQILRSASNVFDLQKNKTGTISYYQTNYGITGYNYVNSKGSIIWPDSTLNQYIFGMGFWFGAQKMKPDKSGLYKYVTLSFDPNNAHSWFVPGRISDTNTIDSSKKDLYRIYFSNDFDKTNGQPLTATDGPAFPYWWNEKQQYPWYLTQDLFESDSSQRNLYIHSNGPAIISDEDIICTYKDSDLSYYDGGSTLRKALGYPLNLQVEQRILNWKKGNELQDCFITQYLITNKSTDTLYDCFFGEIIDADLAYVLNSESGARNDRARFYEEDTTLNLGVVWTGTEYGEHGRGFGYMGVSLIETPTESANGFVESEKYLYPVEKQIGLHTYRNWSIDDEVNMTKDSSRYQFMSSGLKDGDLGARDVRLLFSTGPFNLIPEQSVRFALLIAFAPPCVHSESDGDTEDIDCTGGLIDKVKKAYKYYYKGVTSVPEKQSTDNDILIFPNPASNSIEIKNVNIKINEFSIFNTYGECLINQKSNVNDNSNICIDISSLPIGMYYLKIANRFNKFLVIR